MSDWNDLHKQLVNAAGPHDTLRIRKIKNLANYTQRNVIIYYSGWIQKPTANVDFGINDADKTGFMTAIHGLDRSKGLDLVLHTPGGEMSATESLIEYLREMFGTDIRAIIPQIAMSGGSMIACSCKEIIMGAQSCIGPFDPQLNGTACQAILEDLQAAIEEMGKNQIYAYKWQPIIQKYNLGFFAQCQHAIEMADEVVIKNLNECMFADLPEDERTPLIKKIVGHLGSHRETKEHARHIHKRQAKQLGLKIIDLESDQKLQDAVLSLHHACMLTLDQTNAAKIIENQKDKSVINLLTR